MIIPYRLKEKVLYLIDRFIAKRYKNASALRYERIRGIFLTVRVGTDFIFNIVNDLGFLIVIKPSSSPFGNFIFRFPFTRDGLFIKTRNLSKLFYTQFAFFKFIFKFLIIHFKPLKVYIVELYQNKSNQRNIYSLTLKLLLVYNSYEKSYL